MFIYIRAQLADQDDPNVIDRHTCIDPDKGHMDWVKKPVRSSWLVNLNPLKDNTLKYCVALIYIYIYIYYT